MKTSSPLNEEQIEHFLETGYVVIRGAIDPEVCDAAVAEAFERCGYDREDPSTWTEKKIHLPTTSHQSVAEASPAVWAATCQLLGGEERVYQPYNFGNAYILNLGVGADEPFRKPSPECPGWHKDGDFFRHFLNSPEQGLLTLVAWSDIKPRGGATYVATDSVGVVARKLVQHPEGLLPGEIGCDKLIYECNHYAEATAHAGDVYLLHPYMLHCHSQNMLEIERVITNPPAALKEPMNFNRPDGDYSPVEQAVLRGMGVDHYDFQPTRPREAVIPERRKRQLKMLEEEKARELEKGKGKASAE